MTAAASLITALGIDVGLPELRLDGEGRCVLDFDATRVTFEADEATEALFLYATLGLLPADAPVATMERLLAANLFWRGTGGATLGFDPASRRIVLAQSLPASRISEVAFKATVERFVTTAELWSASLTKAEADGGADVARPQHWVVV